MKLETKKLIAREFLLMLIVIGISVIVFISTFAYNSYKKGKYTTLQNEIILKEKTNQQLSHSFTQKFENHAWLYNVINENFDLSNSGYDDPEKLWERFNVLIVKDSLRYKYVHNTKVKRSFELAGLSNVGSVEKFIKQNTLTSIENSNIKSFVKNRKIINSLKSKTKKIRVSILTNIEITKRSLMLLFIGLVIIFPLRFLFYSINWSIKILKQS